MARMKQPVPINFIGDTGKKNKEFDWMDKHFQMHPYKATVLHVPEKRSGVAKSQLDKSSAAWGQGSRSQGDRKYHKKTYVHKGPSGT